MGRTVQTDYGEACSNCFEKVGRCNCIFTSCCICGEDFPDSELYEYRGAVACQKDFSEATEKREAQRQRVMEVTDKAIRSQADGEWHNGGYKTMKTDKSGRPITKVKEPLILKEYEEGKL